MQPNRTSLIELSALTVLLMFVVVTGCNRPVPRRQTANAVIPSPSPSITIGALPAQTSPQLKQLIEAAVEQSKVTTGYDPSWVKIDYPGGDVPQNTGVCSDVVVRAFRKTGVDLQKEVHEDMTRAWSVYPRRWRASGTDTSIDHRRVLNLMTYFNRQQKSLPVTQDRAAYLPGDVIAWELSDGVEHIGILTNYRSQPDQHYLVVHNIGAGARIEDVLLTWKIIGHYRYF